MSQGYAIAYCDIARQYYRLTLKDNRTVVDFASCDGDSIINHSNSARKTRLTTDSSLRPCPVCGSRVVGRCDCLRRVLPCEPLVGFRFSCIYCSNLRFLAFYT